MTNYLFLGLLYNKEEESLYLSRSKCGLQNATNTFQWNLIDGIIENGCSVQIVNALPVGTFPNKYKSLFLKKRKWKYKSVTCHECGTINVPLLKQAGRKRSAYREIENWIKNTDGPKNIIVYSLYLPYQKALKRIKKKYPEVKITTIVTDLPSEYGILPENPIKKFINVLLGNAMLANAELNDSFVLLTEHMKAPLGIKNQPCVIVEGICPNEARPDVPLNNTQKKIIFYSGTLKFEYSIQTLLDAFSLIDDDNCELWICGSGEAEHEIKRRAEEDKRIHFFGYCTSEKVSQLRAQSSVLVNPRTSEGEYTKYSFPSKTMEYLASGIPTVAYKLSGIPDEYGSYLNYAQDNSPETLKKIIMEICDDTSGKYNVKAKQGREFVEKCKCPAAQAKKIIDMIENET